MSEKDIVKEAREMADDHRYDIQPHVRATLGALADEVERLRKQLVQTTQDARYEAQAAADEAYWRDKQGDEYGSY